MASNGPVDQAGDLYEKPAPWTPRATTTGPAGANVKTGGLARKIAQTASGGTSARTREPPGGVQNVPRGSTDPTTQQQTNDPHERTTVEVATTTTAHVLTRRRRHMATRQNKQGGLFVDGLPSRRQAQSDVPPAKADWCIRTEPHNKLREGRSLSLPSRRRQPRVWWQLRKHRPFTGTDDQNKENWR